MPLLNLSEASSYYRFDGAARAPRARAVAFARPRPRHVGRAGGGSPVRTSACCATTLVVMAHRRAPPGDYSIAELGRDVLAIADACDVRAFAFCGLSLGGMIGQWLAANAPERADPPRTRQHDVAVDRSAADGGAPARGAREGHVGDRGPGDGPVLLAGRARLAFAARGNSAPDAAVHPSPRLRRLLRGHPGHGSHGAPLEDPRAHARDQRRPRRRHAVGGPRGRPRERDRGSPCGPAPGGAHFQPRAPAIVQRGAPRLPGAAASRDPRCRIRAPAAQSSETTMSIARLPRRPTSRAIFRS